MAGRRSCAAAFAVGAIVAAAGCVGSVGGDGEPPGIPDPAGGGGSGALPPAPEELPPIEQLTLTPARLWRLTPAQYANTIEAAFGFRLDLGALALTEKYESFVNPASGGLGFDEVFTATLEETLSAQVTAQRAKFGALLGCGVQALDAACLSAFVKERGRILFRTNQVNAQPYLDLFATLRAQLDPAESFDAVITTMLLSPSTWFRRELGGATDPATGPVRLAGEQIAEALAYTLWNRPPDAALLDAAATLTDPAERARQIERMLAGATGNEGLHEFFTQFLGLSSLPTMTKNPALFPGFNDALKTSMLREVRQFVDDVLRAQGGDLTRVLDGTASFVDTALGRVYGVTAPAGGARVELPRDQRRGVFTLAGPIAAMSESSLTGIMYRAKVMLAKLLCQELAPPPGVVEFPDPEKAGLPADATMRQRMTLVENQAACRGCHVYLHPIGFAMENYDATGAFRTLENDRPINPAGGMTWLESGAMTFSSAADMLGQLAQRREVHECMAEQMFDYVYGRRAGDGDRALVHAAFDHFAKSSLNLRALLHALVSSDAFVTRERS